MLSKRVGRPPGHFEFMVDRCRRLVASLAGRTLCNASDAFLAEKLGVSPRSVRRYLLALKQKGLLTRTTVAFKHRSGKWMKRRLMKTGEESGFGMTREEVLAFRQRCAPKPRPQEKVASVTWKEPVRLAYFNPPRLEDVEGFGTPYHEDMHFGNRPCDAIELPEAVLKDKVALVQAMLDTPRTADPEYTKLSCRYIRANIRRATRNGNIYPLGVID